MNANLSLVPDLSRPDSVPGIRIDDVIVGERARKDYGDLTDLMESIREVGLLQPIGLTPGNHLLFGGRRLEACRALGWESIPFVRPETQTDAISLLHAERDENTCRKAMTPEELVDLGIRLEELERPKAKERQGTRFDLRPTSGPGGPEVDDPETNRTAHVVGEALGLSRNTYKRIKTVVTTARDETVEADVRDTARAALDDLNSGKATPTSAYNRVREAREPKPAPTRPPSPPRFGTRRKHRQVLEAMTTALAGLTSAADEITELDNTVTKEEATHILRDLSQQIRSLNQIKALLKERIR